MKNYHQKYNKYKSKYLKLKGGDLNDHDFKVNLKHNVNVFFDKGSNNVWMDTIQPDKQIRKTPIASLSLNAFEKYLLSLMDDRYYVRITNLDHLMTLRTMEYGTIININFLEDFYINLFKGTAYKQIIQATEPPSDQPRNPNKTYIDSELAKAYDIYIEFDQADPTLLPIKKYYTFADKPNPCHLAKILKDEYGRNQSSNLDKYAFLNLKLLGKGAAGTASLFGYYSKQNPNLKIAAKLMASNQFTITNSGKYLPLQILYFDSTKTSTASIAKADSNMRFIYRTSTIADLKLAYPGYDKWNIFDTDHPFYKKIMLSVASDNFSNQTLMHMIIEKILDKFYLPNYIKQFDAMLCQNEVGELAQDKTKSWLDVVKDSFYYAVNYLSEKIGFEKPTVDGLNFMEIADAGDLYGHLFEIQKKKFSEVRQASDIFENGKFTDKGGMLQNFLNEMIGQILQPLSILQHPRHAFVHGDLKSKNIFVKKSERGFIYKIADYDKSSINYHGIRFYNEGSRSLRLFITWLGPGQMDETNKIKVEDIFGNRVQKEDTGFLAAMLSKLGGKTALVFDFLDPASLSEFIAFDNKKEKADQLDKTSILYDISIAAYFNIRLTNKTTEATTKIMAPIFDRLQKENFNLSKLLLFISDRIVKLNSLFRFEKIRDVSKLPIIDGILYYYDFLFRVSRSTDINIFYDLNGNIARMSNFVTSLESVEFEQLYVRYLPIPFYHTIDLYTLFLSLMQSPMVYTYLRCAHQNKAVFENDLFWKSFRDLWISDNDVYTIFGYYEYFYRFPPLEEQASIGFILDPIKKNPISLLKRVDESYWARAWGRKWPNIKNSLDTEGLQIQKKLKLSTGSRFTMPQVCLTEKCANFDLKVHRDGKVFYINNDMMVYNVASIIEAARGAWMGRTNIIEKLQSAHKESVYQTLIYRLDGMFHNYDGIITQFDLQNQVNAYIKNKGDMLNPVDAESLIIPENSNDIRLAFLSEKQTMLETIKNQEEKNHIMEKIKYNYTEIILNLLEYVNNLKNKLIEGSMPELEKYIKEQAIKQRTGAAINICKTNSYKDVFGNDMNWDYCPIPEKEIDDLLRKIKLPQFSIIDRPIEKMFVIFKEKEYNKEKHEQQTQQDVNIFLQSMITVPTEKPMIEIPPEFLESKIQEPAILKPQKEKEQ